LILGEYDPHALHDPQARRSRGAQSEMQLEQGVLMLDARRRHHVRNAVHQLVAHAVAVGQRVDVRDRPAFLRRNDGRGSEVDRLGTHGAPPAGNGSAAH